MSRSNRNGRPLIAWVEDDPGFRSLVRGWLLPRYEVAAFEEAGPLLERIDDLAPAAAILDVRLPGPDGFDVCRRVRKHRRLASTPVLFLTSCKGNEEYVRRQDIAGAAYLTKPIGKQELLWTLQGLLASRKRRN